MSRSGYSEDLEPNELARWRGAVSRAIGGRRGQAFLREMLAAMDAMPEKVLISEELVTAEGDVCAMGSVCKARGIDTSKIDYDDPWQVAGAVGIARAMAQEIAWENDECGPYRGETPQERFTRMRAWIVDNLAEPSPERREEV